MSDSDFDDLVARYRETIAAHEAPRETNKQTLPCAETTVRESIKELLEADVIKPLLDQHVKPLIDEHIKRINNLLESKLHPQQTEEARKQALIDETNRQQQHDEMLKQTVQGSLKELNNHLKSIEDSLQQQLPTARTDAQPIARSNHEKSLCK